MNYYHNTTMREHTITKLRELLEAKIRKMVKTKKRKAKGPRKHTLSQIFAVAKRKSRRMPPGDYYFEGVHIHIDSNKKAFLECPHCGMRIDDYIDYTDHQKQYHYDVKQSSS